MKKNIILIVLIFNLFTIFVHSETFDNNQNEVKENFVLNRYVLCQEVKNREPYEEKKFFREGEQVWFFNDFENIQTEQSVIHIWYYLNNENYEEVSRTSLNIRGARFRTWSYITANKGGYWKVELLDNKDNVIVTREFEIE